MAEFSEKGIYLDNESGKIVEEPPERGVQLVAPGGELTEKAKAEVEFVRGQFPQEAEPEPEPDTPKRTRKG